MSGPIEVDGRWYADPPALLAEVVAQAARGARPSGWIASAAIDPALKLGLSAAMIRHDHGPTVAEGARLAGVLGDPRLIALCRLALDTQDTGVLLAADPADAGHSVEDALLVVVARSDTHDDAATRESMLTRLRNAGLRDEELWVLLGWGTAREVTEWLPGLCEEGVPDGLDAVRPELRAAVDSVRAALG